MDDDRQIIRPGAGTKLSREQKAGFVFVIVCGLCALVLGGQYLWTHMASPFAIVYSGPKFLLGSEEEAAKIAEQRKQDTDLDGINDYDELYIYKTSPYLADSDSDGLQDGVEITSNQDPNCAVGANCASSTNEDIVLFDGSEELDLREDSLAARQEALSQALIELYSLPTNDIRTMLVESGTSQAQVEAMTDDEVNALYQNILLQLQEQGEIEKLIPQDLLDSTSP